MRRSGYGLAEGANVTLVTKIIAWRLSSFIRLSLALPPCWAPHNVLRTTPSTVQLHRHATVIDDHKRESNNANVYDDEITCLYSLADMQSFR